MAEVSFVGNLGADPELRFTNDGKAVLDFSVAENHSKRGPGGEWTTTGTTWWRVSVWERQAEALANTLSKGDRVLVVGRSQTREFTKKDGQQGKSLECQASRVGVVPKPPEQGNQQGQSWGGGQAPWGQQEAPF